MTGGGDLYCFVYKDKVQVVNIILYEHDTDDIIEFGVDFEEFLIWQMYCAIVEYDQEIDESIIEHSKYLKDEHRTLFENKNIEAIIEIAKKIEEKMDVMGQENLQKKFYDVME